MVCNERDLESVEHSDVSEEDLGAQCTRIVRENFKHFLTESRDYYLNHENDTCTSLSLKIRDSQIFRTSNSNSTRNQVRTWIIVRHVS